MKHILITSLIFAAISMLLMLTSILFTRSNAVQARDGNRNSRLPYKMKKRGGYITMLNLFSIILVLVPFIYLASIGGLKFYIAAFIYFVATICAVRIFLLILPVSLKDECGALLDAYDQAQVRYTLFIFFYFITAISASMALGSMI